MPYLVTLVKSYRHPRTGKRLSIKKALIYNRRAKKRLKPYIYLQVRHTLGDLKGLTAEQKFRRKRNAGKIAYKSRLTQVEKVLPLKSISDGSLRLTLGRNRVFSTIYEDFKKPGVIQRRGSIRVTIGGVLNGKKIKQITHLAFSKTHWKEAFASDEYAYEKFKDWMMANILANLRRKNIRLSSVPKSRGRIKDLEENREGMLSALDLEESPIKRAEGMKRIKWATEAIRKQKKSSQLKQAFIRIEKLI